MASFTLDVASLHAFYRAGGSVETVVDAVLARIAAVGDPGIFLATLDRAAMLVQASGLPAFDPQAFPLWGVPFAVKDNIDTAGMPTTAACPAFAYLPDADAAVVAALRAAGAILVGKTNLDQFATGLVGVRTPYPAPRNAFDAARVPGGSSSGSAVAVAQGIVAFALGTDTAGSGRVPAGLNHIVGLKPSLGALSTRGVVAACRSLDCVSVFARSVADARAAFDVMAGYDALDPFSRTLPAAGKPLRRLGVPRPQDRLFFGDAMQAQAYAAALREVASLGLPMVEIDMGDFFETARLLYEGPYVAERRAAIGTFFETNARDIHPVTRAIVAGADRFSAADAFTATYRRKELARRTMAVWERIDAMVLPTAPVAPTIAELEADPIGPNSRLGTYTNFVNLLDLAALAVPGPKRADGFPAGITLVGPHGADHALAALGERIFPGTGGVADARSKEAA